MLSNKYTAENLIFHAIFRRLQHYVRLWLRFPSTGGFGSKQTEEEETTPGPAGAGDSGA